MRSFVLAAAAALAAVQLSDAFVPIGVPGTAAPPGARACVPVLPRRRSLTYFALTCDRLLRLP